MSSKYAFGALMVLAICVTLFPRAASCAEWNLSPFRAQLASADGAGQSDQQQVPADTASSIAVNPLKKNIGRAALFSLIIPGTGELYAGSWLRAVPFFAAEVVGWTYFAMYHGKGNTKTDAFEAYAGWRDTPNNFNTRAYMFAEYQVAIDSFRAGSAGPYHGNFSEWQQLSWDERYSHLPAPFTHDINTDDRQQFFEMIGKYLLQFGWGWKDTYNSGSGNIGTDPNNPAVNWQQPSNGLTADNANTIEFDGGSPMFFHYRDMRGLANSYYNKGNVAMEVVLVNHLLSAFDAAFAVRSQNKRLEAESSPKIGHILIHYNAQPTISGDMARYVTVTLPLN